MRTCLDENLTLTSCLPLFLWFFKLVVRSLRASAAALMLALSAALEELSSTSTLALRVTDAAMNHLLSSPSRWSCNASSVSQKT